MEKKEPVIDFSAIVQHYKRYWWLFAISLLACLALAVMYLKLKKPVYLVQSIILVDPEDNAKPGASSMGSSLLKSMALGGGSRVEDEIVVMGSQQLRMLMVKELKLNRSYIERRSFFNRVDHYNDSPIEVDAPDALFDTLSTSFLIKVKLAADGKADIRVKKGYFKTLAQADDVKLPANVKTPYGIFHVKTTAYYRPGSECNVTATVMGNIPKAEALSRTMVAELLRKKANAIDLNTTETNVERGRDKLNTIIRLYNERGQDEKDRQAINTAKFIDDRLELVYRNLMGSEAEIEAYKRAHNLVDPELQAKSVIGRQDMADQAIINLEARYRIVSMIKDFVADPANKHSFIPFSADSTAATSAIAAYNNLIMQRMKLENSAINDNPSLQRLDGQIDAMRDNVVNGVDNTLRALRVQLAKAGAVSGKAAGTMRDIPTTERQTRALYRQQGIQNEIYTFLLQKREENALVLAATTPKGKVVDAPYGKSEPLSPNKPLVILLALLASAALPMIILAVKNMLTTRFASPDELDDITAIPVIGHIHHNRHDTQLVVKDGRNWSIVELFRYVRNNVQFMMPNDGDKVVLVTSSVSGEGKSVVSLNLAAAFALLGKRVALVGMDIRKPRLAQMTGLNPSPGVTAFLAKPDTALDQIVQPLKQVQGLDVLVAGDVPPNPSELLLGKRTEQLFELLRQHYDVIVVDSAPVAMVSDTFSLTRFAHITVAVTRARYTKRKMVKDLQRLVDEGRLTNVGLVLNDTKPNQDNGYGYGYGDSDND
ncbi:MAG: polysaccharide biosynthesis tyrosine autokinase [Muribaculaceae bacterium]|nr:polysaccharide biosynthesis tyrosine autokinase [Muribaculaceae bacterium]